MAFADWLITPGQSVVRAQRRQPRLVPGSWAAASSTSPTTSAPTIRPPTPSCSRISKGNWSPRKYDLQHLFRLILNSRTYQQSSIPRSDRPDAEALFACYPVRRLDAEVLIDALNWIGGTGESYSSPIPEPFTFIPEDQRTIALADGSITSPFLEMFGRPARDTGLESERNNQPTDAQRLYLLNSSDMQRRIARSPRLRAVPPHPAATGRN